MQIGQRGRRMGGMMTRLVLKVAAVLAVALLIQGGFSLHKFYREHAEIRAVEAEVDALSGMYRQSGLTYEQTVRSLYLQERLNKLRWNVDPDPATHELILQAAARNGGQYPDMGSESREEGGERSCDDKRQCGSSSAAPSH